MISRLTRGLPKFRIEANGIQTIEDSEHDAILH